ncbi:methylosome subunit pICln [Musca domestica]|uniref:Methylosome subunit pICln n=1 Tax=Musca domestica TaxID=7370 RepID=A0A9J7D241_MUSDO|nr:methylosome subunit pICln [Musca domestica]
MVIIGQVAPPTEGVVFTSDNVTLRIEQNTTVGKGNVYISHSSLMWKPANEPDGISISWKRIGVHGTASAPSKCICFVLDRHISWPGKTDGGVTNGNGQAIKCETNGDGNGNNDDAENDDEEEEEEVFEDAEEDQLTECWLIPDDVNIVDTMYQAMTECQALHPDSDDSISGDSDMEYDEEDDGEGEFDDAGDYTQSTGNGDNGGVETACAGINNLSVDQFADAEE